MTELQQIEDPLLRRIVYALGILGVIVLLFYTAGLLLTPVLIIFNMVSPFIVAFILAYVLAPVVLAIQRRLRLGRIAGTLVVFFFVLAVFFLALAVVLPVIISQIVALIETLREVIPHYLNRLAENPRLGIDQELIAGITEKLRALEIDYEKVFGSVMTALKTITTGGIAAVGEIVKGIQAVFGFASFLLFVAIIIFYLVLDWEKIGPFVEKAIPPRYRTRTFDILGKLDVAVGGFLRGQLTVSFLVGLFFAVGLFFISFMGFPALGKFSILIGTAAGIGGFIPYLGPIIGVTPALLIVLLGGSADGSSRLWAALAVLGLFTVIQAIEGMVLQPRIVGKGAGLHPLAVLLALLIGAYFGITGMIVAVPIACIIRVLLIEFYWKPIQQQRVERHA